MNRDNYTYTFLCVLFSLLVVLGNLTYKKFVFMPFLPFYIFELSVGAILYPLTFLITDLITEFYGKENAKFCVTLAIIMNIIVACAIAGMDKLEATPWSTIDNISFHNVFGLYSVAFIGSIIACYSAQVLDIKIYLWIKKITKGKWLWARNLGSTIISLFVDTFIVISFMTVFQVLPVERMWPLIINSYSFKLFFSFSNIPLFYLSARIMKRFQYKELII